MAAAGTWLYAGDVPCAVEIRHSDVAYEIDEVADEPITVPRACFYVAWGSPGEPGRWPSEVGPFESLVDAVAYVEAQGGASLRWRS